MSRFINLALVLVLVHASSAYGQVYCPTYGSRRSSDPAVAYAIARYGSANFAAVPRGVAVYTPIEVPQVVVVYEQSYGSYYDNVYGDYGYSYYRRPRYYGGYRHNYGGTYVPAQVMTRGYGPYVAPAARATGAWPVVGTTSGGMLVRSPVSDRAFPTVGVPSYGTRHGGGRGPNGFPTYRGR